MGTRSQERRILFYTLVGHALTHIYVMLYAPLLLLMAKDFSLDLPGITFYVTLGNFFFGLGALPSGWLAGHLGEKGLLVLFFIGCALGGTVVGLAQNLWMLGAGVVLLGTATSIYHPVGTALVSKGVAARGKAMGLNGIAGSVGTAIGPFYAAFLAQSGSWRWSFLALTVPSLLLGLGLWMADLGPAAAPSPRPPAPEGAAGSRRLARPPAPLLWVLGLLLLAMTFGGLYYHLFTTMLPTLLSGGEGAVGGVTRGGLWASVALAFGILGQYVSGVLCDRMDDRKLYVFILAVAAPLVFLLGHLSGGPLLGCACAVSFVIFGVQPVENTLIARYTLERFRGLIYGAKFILTFGVGGTGSWLAGILKTDYGLKTVFEVAAAFTSAGLLSALAASLVRWPAASAVAPTAVTPSAGDLGAAVEPAPSAVEPR
jgi:FSR family fosmidomycin resistance protein-like MFS transporter